MSIEYCCHMLLAYLPLAILFHIIFYTSLFSQKCCHIYGVYAIIIRNRINKNVQSLESTHGTTCAYSMHQVK